MIAFPNVCWVVAVVASAVVGCAAVLAAGGQLLWYCWWVLLRLFSLSRSSSFSLFTHFSHSLSGRAVTEMHSFLCTTSTPQDTYALRVEVRETRRGIPGQISTLSATSCYVAKASFATAEFSSSRATFLVEMYSRYVIDTGTRYLCKTIIKVRIPSSITVRRGRELEKESRMVISAFQGVQPSPYLGLKAVCSVAALSPCTVSRNGNRRQRSALSVKRRQFSEH